MCAMNINIFTQRTDMNKRFANDVSMCKLAIEVCFEINFGLIHAIFLSLGSTKSVLFFRTLDRPFLGHSMSNYSRRDDLQTAQL